MRVSIDPYLRLAIVFCITVALIAMAGVPRGAFPSRRIDYRRREKHAGPSSGEFGGVRFLRAARNV